MAKETTVLLVEDDFYARNWMELLLRRDWRTRVVGEVDHPAKLGEEIEAIHANKDRIDMVVIDTDIPDDPGWLGETLKKLPEFCPKATILLVGVSPNIEVARFVGLPNFAGYILKDEICYSLAWAVALAAEGKFVVTPGVRDLYGVRSRLPRGSLCLDGCKPLEAFSRIEEKRSRMVFIFSMERHEFADEEGISEDYSYGVVSDLFTTIGLNNILQGKVKPEAYFGHNPAVLMHVNQAIKTFQEAEIAYLEAQRAGRAHRKRDAFDTYKMPKVSEKETLAFHLLTLPDIEPII